MNCMPVCCLLALMVLDIWMSRYSHGHAMPCHGIPYHTKPYHNNGLIKRMYLYDACSIFIRRHKILLYNACVIGLIYSSENNKNRLCYITAIYERCGGQSEWKTKTQNNKNAQRRQGTLTNSDINYARITQFNSFAVYTVHRTILLCSILLFSFAHHQY